MNRVITIISLILILVVGILIDSEYTGW
jgi:hypothetical protein